MWIIGIVIGIIVLLFILTKVYDYWTNFNTYMRTLTEAKSYGRKHTTLTFDNFKKYYAVNPDKWEFNYIWVRYITEKKMNQMEYMYIVFPKYKEYKKYREWFEAREERKANEKQLMTDLEFVEYMKRDCNELKAKSSQQVKEACANSMELIKQAVAEDKDINDQFSVRFNEDGSIELVRKGKTKTTRLTTPEGSISCL